MTNNKEQADLTTQQKKGKGKKYIIEQVPRKYAEDKDATTKSVGACMKTKTEELEGGPMEARAP